MAEGWGVTSLREPSSISGAEMTLTWLAQSSENASLMVSGVVNSPRANLLTVCLCCFVSHSIVTTVSYLR